MLCDQGLRVNHARVNKNWEKTKSETPNDEGLTVDLTRVTEIDIRSSLRLCVIKVDSSQVSEL